MDAHGSKLSLEYLISEDCVDTQMDYIEEMTDAINALEKQIPKKPIPKSGNAFYGIWHGVCKSCGAELNSTMNYCFKCGNAIDWSENSESDADERN